jgi:hypothetical protein
MYVLGRVSIRGRPGSRRGTKRCAGETSAIISDRQTRGVSLNEGDYVQILRSNRRYQVVPRGTRGTVRSLDGDWVGIELPNGGRFQTHIDNVTRLLRVKDIAREESV